MAVLLFYSCDILEKTNTTGAPKLLVSPWGWDGRLTPNRTRKTFQRDEDIPHADAGG